MLTTTLSLSTLALAAGVSAQIRGFNYGALYADNRARFQQDWEADFKAAQALPGVGGFSSARLFTMIQGYTTDTVTSAFPAAISTKTSLLLGLWCSGGEETFQNELTALKNAAKQFPDADIVGISIGSEDLYRISPTGIENESGPGAQPDQLVSYIKQARQALQGTPWSNVGIGHVDTWTAYVNGSNAEVIANLDWVGMDSYPYFQTVNENSIDNAADLFFQSYDVTMAAAQGKPVWITETGWPVTGAKSGQATAGTDNAETYWKAVACKILGAHNTWWYQLNDGADQATSFKVVNPDALDTPLYDLSCPKGSNTTSSSTSASAPKTSISSGSTVVLPTGASATSTQSLGPQGGSPNNQQNAGVSAGNTASGPAPTANANAGQSSGSSEAGAAGAAAGVGNTSPSSNSNSTAPVAGSPSSSEPAAYAGAAFANVPTFGLLVLGALLALF